MKKLLFTLITVFAVSCLTAQTAYTSAQSGNWTDPATWGAAAYPVPGDTVTINAPHNVVLNTDTLGTGDTLGISLFVDNGAFLTHTQTADSSYGVIIGLDQYFKIKGYVNVDFVAVAGYLTTGGAVRQCDTVHVFPTGRIETTRNFGMAFCNSRIDGVIVAGDSLVNGSYVPYTDGRIEGKGRISASVFYHGAWDDIFGIKGTVFDANIPNNSTVAGATWRGGVDSDWDNASNWSQGVVPDSSYNIAILTVADSVRPVLDSVNGRGASMAINMGDTLIIKPSATLTLEGEFMNYGYLKLESDATNTASFISEDNVSGSGNVTVQNYITDGAWHFVSPPTTETTLHNYFFFGSPKTWLQYFDEASNNWVYIVALATPVNVGQGYRLWVDANSRSNVTVEYSGDITIAAQATSLDWSGPANGWNVLGNPYTAAFDFDTGPWTFIGTEKTIWIWDQGSGGYLYWTESQTGNKGNGIIPIGQGFFVHGLNAEAFVLLDPSYRTHSSQAFYKSKEEREDNRLSITVSKGQFRDEAQIAFGANGTEGFDNGWDASKLFSPLEAPQIYLVEEDREQSIDYLPLLQSDERTVALNLEVGEDGQHTFSAKVSQLENTRIILEDLQTGELQDLGNNPVYTFDASVGDNPERFVVHFYASATGIGHSNMNDEMNIYANDKTISISFAENLSKSGNVTVVDMYGRTLVSQQFEESNLFSIPVNVRNNYLIVRVVSEGNVFTQKVFIK